MNLPKYRAWHKTDEVMYHVSALYLDANCMEHGAGILDEHNDFHKLKDAKFYNVR